MPFYKSQAIVLQTTDYAEWDKIVSLYTKHFGRIKGIAKGAKRSQRRFGGALEPLCHIEVNFFEKEGHGFTRLENCRVLNNFCTIGNDVKKIAFGSYLLELINMVTPEKEKNLEIFKLLAFFLNLLNTKECREDFLRIFELRLTSLIGYQPQFLRCVKCRKNFNPVDHYRFSVRNGGILCSKCHRENQDFLTLSHGTIRMFQQVQYLSLLKLNRIYFSPNTLKESRQVLGKFLEYHLGKRPKSLDFIQKLSSDSR